MAVVKIVRVLFVCVTLVFLTGCLTSEEKIVIEKDGSVLFTQKTTIKREHLDQMLALWSEGRGHVLEDFAERTVSYIIEKYKKIDGVKYAGWTTDLSIDSQSEDMVNRFELKVESLLSFPSILREIADTTLNDDDIWEIVSGLPLEEMERDALTQSLKGQDINVESTFIYTIRNKYDRIYQMGISTDSSSSNPSLSDEEKMALDMLKRMNPSYQLVISAPDIEYTNLEYDKRDREVTISLDGNDLVSSDLSGIVEFELGLLGHAKVQALDFIND